MNVGTECISLWMKHLAPSLRTCRGFSLLRMLLRLKAMLISAKDTLFQRAYIDVPLLVQSAQNGLNRIQTVIISIVLGSVHGQMSINFPTFGSH